MTILLLLLYVGVFSWLIRRAPYFAQSGISPATLIAIFLIKTVVGISYGLIHKTWYLGGDTWIFFEESQRIAATFADYPQYYIYSILGWPVETPAADVFIYPSSSMFWRDLGTYLVVHLNAALIPFSGGIYEVHVVFMAFLSLCAGINLYRVFGRFFELPPQLLLVGCFLMPSLLFWTAGIHKDVLLFWGLSLVLLALIDSRMKLLFLGLLVVGSTRHYVLALLLPAFFAYFWAQRFPRNVIRNLSIFFVAGLAAVVALDTFLLDNKMWSILSARQLAFLQEVGTSKINAVAPLENGFSLFYQIPLGLVNAFARPFIWDSQSLLQFCAAFETLVILIIFALAAIFSRTNASRSPLFYFLLVFALVYLLLIGLLVANEGTIVRYRAVPLGFLVVLAWHLTDFARLRQAFAHMIPQKSNNFRTYP